MTGCSDNKNKYYFHCQYYCSNHLKNLIKTIINYSLEEIIEGGYNNYSGIDSYEFNNLKKYIIDNNLTEKFKDLFDEINEITECIKKFHTFNDKYNNIFSSECKISDEFKKSWNDKCKKDLDKNTGIIGKKYGNSCNDCLKYC